MGRSVFAVVSDRFYGTTLHCFPAKVFFLWSRRLLVYVGIAPVVAAREIGGCGFPAQIAVDALVIDIEVPCDVFGVFVRGFGHKICFASCTRTPVISGGSVSSSRISKAISLESSTRRNCVRQGVFESFFF
jgi:hypothetical protein